MGTKNKTMTRKRCQGGGEKSPFLFFIALTGSTSLSWAQKNRFHNVMFWYDYMCQWLTYEEVLLRAQNFGSGLISMGLKPGMHSMVGIYSR